MKFFFSIVVFFTTILITAQTNNEKSVLIEYNLISINGYVPKKIITKCTKSKSISKTIVNSGPANKSDENTNTIHIYEKEKDSYESVNLEEKKNISITNIKNQNYKIIEDLPKMDWKLSKGAESKIISQFVCNKASLNFRGRNYIAWYTPYVSIPFGPWKFYGLPGLILEIYDVNNDYHWTLEKIVDPSNEIFDLGILNKLNAKEISLKGFVDELANQHQIALGKIMKILPRGTVMESDNYTRTSIELVYDWEVDKNK